MTVGRVALVAFLAILAVSHQVVSQPINWVPVDEVLLNGIQNKVFPGCAAAVVTQKGVQYIRSFGNFTYGVPPPATPSFVPAVSLDSRFDIASLTKVVATTTALMIAYQRGDLDLDMPLTDPSLLGPEFGQHGKASITSRNILMHNAGFPPDPEPNYWDRAFGCPETMKLHPAENFSCREKIYDSLMAQRLQYPINGGYVYSDISMITGMFVAGKIARTRGYVRYETLDAACAAGLDRNSPLIDQCYYESFVRQYVVGKFGLTSTGFTPDRSLWSNIVPTWNDTTYRHLVIQGTVSDGNAYALGGIAGHAGFFSTVIDIAMFSHRILFATPNDPLVNSTTVEYWTKAENLTQSSRALGWDTNDYKMNTYRGCGNFSPLTFTHTGYTGTQICMDPVNKIAAILFTNRVYPDANGNAKTIQAVRQAFSNTILSVMGKNV